MLRRGADGVGGQRRLVTLLALACSSALLFASSAQGAVHVVDSVGDQPDAAPDSGGCQTALETCTLRAAIEESNQLVMGGDQVRFDPELFDGEIGDTIALGSPLPAITNQLRIQGNYFGLCETDAGVPGPCAGVSGPAGETALTLDKPQIGVSGLAITGAGVGVEVAEGRSNAGPIDNWFGVDLAGGAAGNGVGLLLAPESYLASVFGNTFAYNSEAGLDVEGAYMGSVLRNRFGVLPQDGTEAAPNGNDVEVGSLPGSPGSVRIGQEGNGGANTAACDSGCNVIAGDIDLSGDDPGEEPGQATIRGAYIGLDATGTVALPHAGPRILVGDAGNTQVGGLEKGEGNYIVGGSVAVQSSSGTPSLRIERNLIGYSWNAASTLEPPSDAAVRLESSVAGFSSTVRSNRIAMSGGTAVDVPAGSSRVTQNQIEGGDHGVLLAGAGSEVAGNTLTGQGVNGVLVAADESVVKGNTVLGAGAAGVRIESATDTLVGGEAPADENAISGSGGDAIEVVGPQESANEVARNHGDENADLFIDLGGDGAGNEPTGPNDGIQAPTFTALSPNYAYGTARPGALVRVFAKTSPASGELGAYIGSAVADEAGSWELGHGAELAPETNVAATQTDAGASSELALGALEPDTDPPQTTISEAPPFLLFGEAAEVEYFSDEPGTFECSLDLAPFAPCEAALTLEGLKKGPHLFAVRAVDLAGNVDPTPAVAFFIRVK